MRVQLSKKSFILKLHPIAHGMSKGSTEKNFRWPPGYGYGYTARVNWCWSHTELIHLPADLCDHWDPEPLVLQRAEDIISIVNLVMDELLLEKKDIFLKVAEGLGQDLGQIIQKSRIFHCHIWL